jgi:hypothetical protein
VRRLSIVVLLAACTHHDSAPLTYQWGPYPLAAGQEITTDCVSATLHNATDLYVNAVEFDSSAGFHHSNWFVVPDYQFAGPDGTWTCTDRNFDELAAATVGSVLFAQSTQSPHEVQQFAPGVAIKVPAHSKIVADTHLLNTTDNAMTVPLSLTLRTIPATSVTTRLAALSFQNQALGLPPRRLSKFSIDCDLSAAYQQTFGRAPDFSIYYALAHYHKLGTGLTLEAVRDDGTATTIYSTAQAVGSPLGGTLDPAFSMAGFSRIRLACTFDNPRDATVGWGFGDQEMCVFLAFTDSPDNIGGGTTAWNDAGTGVDDGTMVSFTHACDTPILVDASH